MTDSLAVMLRPYQKDAIRALFSWWKDRKRQFPLVVLPTGAGKTFTIVALIKQLLREHHQTRVLILAHRRELLTQFEQSIFDIWPFAPVGIYCASLGRRDTNAITIASRDSIARDPQKLGRFDLVVVDEAHNIDDKKKETRYMKILRSILRTNPSATVVGLTATPFRDVGGYIYGKDRLFAGVAHEIRLKWMIENGYLVKPVSKQVAITIDTAGLRSVAGDFNLKQLNERVNDAETVRACISEWERSALAQGRTSTVFFAVSIRHAILIAIELLQRGLDCPIVTGDTPKDERDEILARFAAGLYVGVVNVGVLTEGTDIPCIDCIALLRPTRSLKLFIQMVGRGLRLHPKKENCLLLDFGGNLQRFGPVDIAEPVAKGKGDDRTRICPRCLSVVGFYKRKCPDCDFDLQPPLSKECPECGEENAPGRRECIACGYEWPIELDATASTDAAYSGDFAPNIRAFDVERILCSVATSRKTGKEYLRITYVCDALNRFHKNLMIGYGGYPGRRAINELRALMGPFASHGVPESPVEAVALHRDNWLLRPVERIHVDLNSKFNEITSIEFSSMETAAHA